jgi:large subunit ribosomal protein L37Ae
MAKRTKKVGPSGRFQARYGVRARTQVRNIEITQRKKHICPSCGDKKVKRVSTSIWQCRKCGIKFAGGAYQPQTDAGQYAEKMLRGEIKPEETISKEQPKTEKEVEGEK